MESAPGVEVGADGLVHHPLADVVAEVEATSFEESGIFEVGMVGRPLAGLAAEPEAGDLDGVAAPPEDHGLAGDGPAAAPVGEDAEPAAPRAAEAGDPPAVQPPAIARQAMPAMPTIGEALAALAGELGETAAVAPTVAAIAATADRRKTHVVVELARTRFALPLAQVSEVGRLPSWTPVPRLPAFLRGVANLRGDMLALVDLRVFLRLGAAPSGRSERLLVVRASDGMVTGLVVDKVLGARPLSPATILQPAAPLRGEVASYLRGVVDEEDDILLVLDLERLLRSPELRAFEPDAGVAAAARP